jgi:DNA-binding response OmpR family regulator
LGTTSTSVSKATATRQPGAAPGGAAPSRHRNKPEIVLLDLGLPDLDGVDLARTIRRDNPEILLVILTARSDEIDVMFGRSRSGFGGGF